MGGCCNGRSGRLQRCCKRAQFPLKAGSGCSGVSCLQGVFLARISQTPFRRRRRAAAWSGQPPFTARARLPSRARCCYPARLALRNERILPGLERHMKRRLLAHSLAFFCGARSDTRAACSSALVSASCCKGCFPLKHSIFLQVIGPAGVFFQTNPGASRPQAPCSGGFWQLSETPQP